MLNSRYAPVVALTVVGILIVAALGWFLAISPALSEAADIRERATTIDNNTQQIQMNTARLSQYEQELNDAPEIAETVALNAPDVFEVEVVRNRIANAIADSGVYLIETSFAGASTVIGADADPNLMASNHVARLFASGPEDPDPEAAEFAPVLSPNNVVGPVVQRLYGVPISLSFTGTPDQVLSFLTLITDESDPAMHLGSIEFTARQSDDPEILGVPLAEDGNVVADVTGYLYILEPPFEIVDSEPLSESSLPSRSPFEEISGTQATDSD